MTFSRRIAHEIFFEGAQYSQDDFTNLYDAAQRKCIWIING